MSKYVCYKNPVIRGFYPDPSVCRVNKDYYLVTSSFEYLPGVPLFHSHNLIDWQQIGHCILKEHNIDLTNTPCSGGIFAPTIRYYNRLFYMITTNISQGNFFMSTDDITKGFCDPIWIDIKGIDPSLYFEEERVYVQYASIEENKNCIKQTEIDIKTGELLKEPVIISYGCCGRDVEAPHIYFIDGWYYLMCAEGGTREGHMVSIQRSKDIYGPYASNPNLSGMWSFNADTDKVVTVLSGFKEYTDFIQSTKGSPILDDDSMFESFGYAKSVGSLTSDDKEKELEDAVKIAKESDIVVVAIGEHSHQSGEGGAGIADVVYGKVNPSARLSMTFSHTQ